MEEIRINSNIEFICIHVKKLSFVFQLQGCDLQTAEKLATDVFQALTFSYHNRYTITFSFSS